MACSRQLISIDRLKDCKVCVAQAFNSSATYNVLVKRVFERGHAGRRQSLRADPKTPEGPRSGDLLASSTAPLMYFCSGRCIFTQAFTVSPEYGGA
jgi:hypothetical protein